MRLAQVTGPSLDSRIAGEVKGFDPTRWLPAGEAKLHDRYTLLALAAGCMAFADAGWSMAWCAPRLDYVANTARKVRLKAAFSNSFGFGV